MKTCLLNWNYLKNSPIVFLRHSVPIFLAIYLLKIFMNVTADDTLWLIPLSFIKQSNPKEECSATILKERQCKISILDISPEEWIKLNPGTVGFYRTNYTAEMLKQLIPSISNKTLSPLDRLGILDDLFALVSVRFCLEIFDIITNFWFLVKS